MEKIPEDKPPSTVFLKPLILQSNNYSSRLINKPKWRSFFKENGYARLSQNLFIKVFSTIEEAFALWQMFSPNQSVFDLWEVRKSFWYGYQFTPYFLTLIKGKKEIVGVLPLWFNSDKKTSFNQDYDPQTYTWWGSNWPEDNVFFVKNLEFIPLLLAAAPSPLKLSCIKPLPEYNFLLGFSDFGTDKEKKYFLDLTKISTVEDFLSKLKKKKRYNLRRDRKKILKFKPEIVSNNSNHLETLFSLSIKRFRELYPDNKNEHSAFEDERRKNVFRALLANKGVYQVRILSTVIEGKVEAVEFALVYKKTYYALTGAANIFSYSGLGVFSNLLLIEDALKLGCQKIDFLEGNCNWKGSWQLDETTLLKFTK